MKNIIVILIFFITLGSNCYGADNELLIRRSLTNKVYGLLWQNGNYDELDRMADEYRIKKERTGSGLWKISLFYNVIHMIADIGKKDENFWKILKEKTLRWTEKFPNSPTAHIAHGIVLKNYAWKIRGSGWADSVRPEEWRLFKKHLRIAVKYLETHKKTAGRDPHWYVEMAGIATGEGWEEESFRKLIDEGLKNGLYCYPLYFAAIDYYAPKWYGSAEDIEKFADYAVRKTSEKEGMGLYTRIYWYAYSIQYQDNLFKDSLAGWIKMKEGIDDILVDYPDPWNINNFAKFACLAGDIQKTRELMDMMKSVPMNMVWKSNDFFVKCRRME